MKILLIALLTLTLQTAPEMLGPPVLELPGKQQTVSVYSVDEDFSPCDEQAGDCTQVYQVEIAWDSESGELLSLEIRAVKEKRDCFASLAMTTPEGQIGGE